MTNAPEFAGVWTLAEARDEKISSVSFEVLAWGKDLADKLGVKLASVILGHNLKDKLEELAYHGADLIYAVDHPNLEHFAPDSYSRVLVNLVSEFSPEIFIASATTYGRTIMPVLAATVHTGLTADCTGLDIEAETRLLIQTRPAIGGNVMATIKTPNHRPQMATVRPKSRRPLPRDESRRADIIWRDYPEEDTRSKVRFIEFIADETLEMPLQEADIVVAGGKGMRDGRNFRHIYELAQCLNGAAGASRSAVDIGWITYPHQIGLSGKTVNPRLYVGIGISGAVQHLAGMSSADTIIAINTDPDASIFRVADIGAVGDALQIVPELIRKIRLRSASSEGSLAAEGGNHSDVL